MKLLVLLICLSQSALAITHRYYPTEIAEEFQSGQTQNEELKDLIFKVLTETHQRVKGSNDKLGCKTKGQHCYKQRVSSYKEAKKELFGNLHLTKNKQGKYMVRDVYCHREYTSDFPEVGSIGPGKVPNHNIVNCEHTWPKSRFSRRASKRYQLSDLHHLFPTDSRANSTRSSFDFGYAKNGREPTRDCAPSRFGNKLYEPPHEHKGNVARAMFYFSVRYSIQINSSVESVLKQWHIQDPVDEAERKRNQKIYEFQQNRNPFIDFPQMVSLIQNF